LKETYEKLAKVHHLLTKYFGKSKTNALPVVEKDKLNRKVYEAWTR
jgi:hypothetical protein